MLSLLVVWIALLSVSSVVRVMCDLLLTAQLCCVMLFACYTCMSYCLYLTSLSLTLHTHVVGDRHQSLTQLNITTLGLGRVTLLTVCVSLQAWYRL